MSRSFSPANAAAMNATRRIEERILIIERVDVVEDRI